MKFKFYSPVLYFSAIDKNDLASLAGRQAPTKSISFDYPLGNNEEDYIFDGIEVDLTESDVGVIQAHGVVPFYLEVTEEQIELLSTLDQDNSVMEFDKFKFESAK